jgi:phosphoribosylformimino-5-aminoimidazole carboxamide ribotide isomerase
VILLPAIDILDGRAVRLTRGDFDAPTVYRDDPLAAARAWVEAGARWLHVVDLDGARSGHPVNLEALERIAGELGVPVQCGGGLRSREAIDAALAAGARRVVVGTAAYRDPDLLEAVLAAHGDAVAVAVDVREGRVSVAGWTEDAGEAPEAVLARLGALGVHTFVYTDVDRDGVLSGPDADSLGGLLSGVDGDLIYSGGVGSLDHLRELAGLPLAGVIVGKALYEGRFSVGEAQLVLESAAPRPGGEEAKRGGSS